MQSRLRLPILSDENKARMAEVQAYPQRFQAIESCSGVPESISKVMGIIRRGFFKTLTVMFAPVHIREHDIDRQMLSTYYLRIL
jgi:hypothetical protein